MKSNGSVWRAAVCCGLLAVVCGCEARKAEAQGPSDGPKSYDAVSIKPSKADDNRSMMRMMPGGLSGSNIRLNMLIASAYDVKTDQVQGVPSWAENKGFDIEAKLSPEDAEAMQKMDRDQRAAMGQKLMQSMLAERFGLKVHKETKEASIFELVQAKGGAKLTPADPNAVMKGFDGKPLMGPDGKPATPPAGGKGGGGMIMMGRGDLSAQAADMTTLSGVLARMVHREVVDKTGIEGRYDIHLKYTPDEDGHSDNGTVAADAPPPLYTALEEQLGLKLMSAKGPVLTVVVDNIQQPTEN